MAALIGAEATVCGSAVCTRPADSGVTDVWLDVSGTASGKSSEAVLQTSGVSGLALSFAVILPLVAVTSPEV